MSEFNIGALSQNPQFMQLLQSKLNPSAGLDSFKAYDIGNVGGDTGSIFGSQGFGLNKGTFGAVGQGIGALGDLASIYFGKQQLDLAEDQYNTNKDFGNRNIANQSQTINNTLEARYRAALAAKGQSTEGSGTHESLESYLERSKVDGSPIG